MKVCGRRVWWKKGLRRNECRSEVGCSGSLLRRGLRKRKRRRNVNENVEEMRGTVVLELEE